MTEELSLPAPASEATPPSSRRATAITVAVCAGAALAAIALARSYHRPPPPTEPPAPGMQVGSDAITLSATAPAWSAIKLGTPTAAEPHWSDPVPARIAFDEAHATRVGSPLAGRITSVAVERGQRVKAGAALLTVSSSGLAELRTELAKATGQRTTAHASLERVQALVEAGSLPAKELVSARQDATEADLAVQLAEHKLASLRVAGAGDTSFTVTAPRDGVVVEKNAVVGQLVDPGAGALLAIADLSDVWVIADLFEGDVGAIAPGTKAQVAIGASEREAVVDHVSAVVDPERHTVPVRIRLANADGALRPNAYATVRWFDPTPAAVTLPTAAVLSDGATSYIYVKASDGALRRREVRVGAPSGGRVPVRSGVTASEQVVLAGAILLDNQLQLGS